MKWNLSTRNKNSESRLDVFSKDMRKIFDDFLSFAPSSLFKEDWIPEIEVKEDEKAIHVLAEVPGIEEKDLSVDFKNSMLTICGEKRGDKEEKDEKKSLILSERRYGTFCRTVRLPDGIRADEIKAEFRNGVLKIVVPKTETMQPKKISIKAN